jgi:GNAT superfamily N-acetyltransferase
MNDTPVSLRRAEPPDVPALVILAEQLGYPCQTDVMARRVDELAGRPDHAILVATAEPGEVVGWIHVFVRPLLVAERAAEVGGLVVDDRYRSKGIGDLLLSAAEDWAVQAGFPRLRVRSNVIRERAHAFYEHRGYRRIKSQWVFEKLLPGVDYEVCG